MNTIPVAANIASRYFLLIWAILWRSRILGAARGFLGGEGGEGAGRPMGDNGDSSKAV